MRQQRRVRGSIWWVCANPRCGEVLTSRFDVRARLCPSCRLAGRWGALATFAVVLVVQVVRAFL